MSYYENEAQAADLMRQADRQYYAARKHSRDAGKYDQMAVDMDHMADWYAHRTYDDGGTNAAQAAEYASAAESYRALAAQARELAPKSQERNLFYRKLARSYRDRAAQQRADLAEYQAERDARLAEQEQDTTDEAELSDVQRAADAKTARHAKIRAALESGLDSGMKDPEYNTETGTVSDAGYSPADAATMLRVSRHARPTPPAACPACVRSAAGGQGHSPVELRQYHPENPDPDYDDCAQCGQPGPHAHEPEYRIAMWVCGNGHHFPYAAPPQAPPWCPATIGRIGCDSTTFTVHHVNV